MAKYHISLHWRAVCGRNSFFNMSLTNNKEKTTINLKKGIFSKPNLIWRYDFPKYDINRAQHFLGKRILQTSADVPRQ